MKYIIGIDEGTTSCRAVVFDVQSRIFVSIKSRPLVSHFPHSGWVEQDAMYIYEQQLACVEEAILDSKIDIADIYGIGITNQRESVVVWDKISGVPICPSINWQCRRTGDICSSLVERGYADFIKKKTGLVVDAYFSASKISWILDNVPHARERAERGELLAGTMDSWLVYKLTDGRSHITDSSNASRTMLYDIHTLSWDDELLELFRIPRCILPTVVPSCGELASVNYHGTEIPICGIIGDQQSALFGQHCFVSKMAKNTYGTGCFILANTGNECITSASPLITTVAWQIGGETTYALEGSVFNAGSSVEWIRDELHLVKSSSESSEIALSVEDSGDVYFVPAFSGLGVPYWDKSARGTITGITRNTSLAHIVRATLESIAYSTYEVFELIESELSGKVTCLKVDGGVSRNDFLMQFQADILQVPLIKPINSEATILGAIYMAGIGSGAYASVEDIDKFEFDCKLFSPRENMDFTARIAKWKKAITKAQNWVD